MVSFMVLRTAGQILTDELAIRIAELGLVREASEETALRRATDLASRTVEGCVGASASLWQIEHGAPEPVFTTGSQPALAELEDLQTSWGYGPVYDAARDRGPVRCADSLREDRWPGYATAMLRRGVRCFVTTVHENGPVLLTLTLFGVRPGALDHGHLGIAALLAAQGGAAISNTGQYGDAHRTATQLQQAVQTRGVVDQAKGILMHALDCDAERAYAELLRLSQSRNIKLTALAERIVAGHGF